MRGVTWFTLFVLLLMLTLATFSFASSPAGDSCSPSFDNCPFGFYCSGPNTGLQLSKCCPIGSEYNLKKDSCVGECIDLDKDGFGVDCDAGPDCDDDDSSKYGQSCASSSSSNEVYGPPRPEALRKVVNNAATSATKALPREPSDVPKRIVSSSSHFLTYPLESTTNNYVVSGWKRNNGHSHRGIDYVLNNISETAYIVAAAEGVVMTQHFYNKWGNLMGDYATLQDCINTIPTAAYGNRIMVKHDNGYISVYGHFVKDSLLVEPGQKVQRGQRLGKMGHSGCSTLKHLHFEIRNVSDHNDRYDPYDIYGVAVDYPDRLSPNAKCGDDHLWTKCPPKLGSSPLNKVYSSVVDGAKEMIDKTTTAMVNEAQSTQPVDMTSHFISKMKAGAKEMQDYSSTADFWIGSWMVPHSKTRKEIKGKMPNVPEDKIDLLPDSVLAEMEKKPYTFKYFASIVGSGKKYDLKSNDYKSYKTRGIILAEVEMDYDVPGNVLYGYMGRAAGFSSNILKMMAGLNQLNTQTSTDEWTWDISYFDDPKDQKAIQVGIDLWNDHGLDINQEKLHNALGSWD